MERPTLAFMSRDQRNDKFFIDANGCLTERVDLGGQEVIVHYDDVPESDITSIDGIRCTTALRTVIDVAPELDRTEMEQMVRECLDRRLFTPEEAIERVAKPDMRTRLGAKLVRQIVDPPGDAAQVCSGSRHSPISGASEFSPCARNVPRRSGRTRWRRRAGRFRR